MSLGSPNRKRWIRPKPISRYRTGEQVEISQGNVFDSQSEFEQWNRTRPHWHQPAVVCFLTMRLNDSLPKSVIQRWHHERIEFLAKCGLENVGDWKEAFQHLPPKDQQRFDLQFSRQREFSLDQCHGSCLLSKPEAAEEVANSLMSFHGDRYWMGDFVVMLNHVHCLVAFKNNEIAKKQPGGWMRFSARKINSLVGRSGSLWFPEPFDHLVRNDQQLKYLRSYIQSNPRNARLPVGKYLYRSSKGRF